MRKFYDFLGKYKYFLIGLFLSTFILWPIARPGFYVHHDDVQVIRLYEMDKCIKDLQIPCRWVPDLGGEYGYPLFNYYAPLPYYFGEVFNLISGNLLFSVKMMLIASLIGSYIFMYLLAREFWGEKGGVLSALFYVYVPYHAADLYVRGAMGELWALMFFPLIFWTSFRLFKKISFKRLVLAGLSFSLLVVSHNLSALIFTPILILYVFLLYIKRRNKKFLQYALFALIIGLLLSSFYWIPALAEKKYVHVDTTTMGYFSYTEHFKGLRKLLGRSWDWGPSIREIPGGEKDANWYQIGWVHIALWLVSLLVSLVLFREKKKRWLSYLLWFIGIGVVFSIFMVNPRSLFVWKLIPPLKFLQFPWRFLMFIAFFVSLSAGSIFLLVKKKISIFAWVFLMILVVSYNFSYFKPREFVNITSENYLKGDNWDEQIKRSIFDYLPIYAEMPPAELATRNYSIISGDVKIENFSEGTNWFKFDALARSSSTVQISQYYFPGWKIYINNDQANIDYSNDLGLITVNLPAGQSVLKARLTNTPIRTISNLLTVISIAFLVYLIKRKDV